MEIKQFLGLTILLTLSSKIIRGENESDDLTPRQQEIIQKYEAIATLSYGDKCNYELEAKADNVREDLKNYFSKVFKSAVKQGLSGNQDRYELSPSSEVAQEEFFAGLEEFTLKVESYQFGSNRVCNDTKSLYCDQNVGQCRCGKFKKVKGVTFIHVNGVCKFDVGSGCVQSDFADLTDSLGCRDGSTCLTIIRNKECTLENSFHEAFLDPYRFRRITQTKGYACFCDKESLNNY